jgi:hypothetical protein
MLYFFRLAIAAHAGRNPVAVPLVKLTWAYFSRAARRFDSLFQRVQAGTAAIRPSRPAQPPRSPTETPPPRAPTPPRWHPLPREFGWLQRLVPVLVGDRSQFRHLLGTAEVAAFLEEAPQALRILRPLCRMLGITRGPDLPAALFPEPVRRPSIRPRTPRPPRTPQPPRAPRPPRPRPVKERPLQLMPTQSWREREALDQELAEWHASRPPIPPSGDVLHLPIAFREPSPPPRPLPRPARWLGNGTAR